ncbi:MAG: hypothetical protein JRN20_21055 [Nitrososphaerota archaeon]|nr:hypothetical protein [Nitrososphaerota archaeon]
MTSGADLLRRGATLLREPCPKCGGLQIRYKEKTYCMNCDDIDAVLSPKQEVKLEAKEAPAPTISLRKLMEDKLATVTKQLDATTDVEEQTKLLDLISKYVETLDKLKKTESQGV